MMEDIPAGDFFQLQKSTLAIPYQQQGLCSVPRSRDWSGPNIDRCKGLKCFLTSSRTHKGRPLEVGQL